MQKFHGHINKVNTAIAKARTVGGGRLPLGMDGSLLNSASYFGRNYNPLSEFQNL